MAPNSFNESPPFDMEAVIGSDKKAVPVVYPNKCESDSDYKLQILQSAMNALAHLLIGLVVCVAIMFAYRNGFPLNATSLHVLLCVIGYQLLMAHAILSLSSDNGWSSRLRLVDKRRAHWILQILGSGLAIGGSTHKILDKTVHWNSLHGQFALVALVFTSVSLVNGLASLYAHELRSILNGSFSKLTHVAFGTVAFAFANMCLCCGLDKNIFRNFATVPVAMAAIAVVATMAFIVIMYPLLTVYRKSKVVVKNMSL